jgi:cytochrome c5|tara:strand:+ start:1760 stop:2170 length:411 start_codon:yes stop_codon:yes gene_type:complete
MKKLLVLIATLTMGWAVADSQSYVEQVTERLLPAGHVCIEGEPCTTAVAAVTASAGPQSGDQVYSSACAACHGTGALNAPKLGDVAAWAPRIAKGMDTLYNNAIMGINAMPAKGGNSSLSDDEVKAAIDHMVALVQ